MTQADRDKFKKRHGYEPCFRSWSGPGLAMTNICIKPADHIDADTPCLASLDVEQNWGPRPRRR